MHQIVITVDDAGQVGVQSNAPLAQTLGYLRIAESALLTPKAQKAVVPAPAGALHLLNGDSTRQ